DAVDARTALLDLELQADVVVVALLQRDRLAHLTGVQQPAQLHVQGGAALASGPGRSASGRGAPGEKRVAEQQAAECDTGSLQEMASREIGEHRVGHAGLLIEIRARDLTRPPCGVGGTCFSGMPRAALSRHCAGLCCFRYGRRSCAAAYQVGGVMTEMEAHGSSELLANQC